MTQTKLRYDELYKGFTWERCMQEHLDWAPRGHFNVTYEAIDRHASDPRKAAIFYVSPDGREEKYTFREMKHLTSQFANVLRSLGVQKGDRVARMLPRTIENYITFLGTWKAGAVDLPVFTAYGPEAIEYRVKDAGATVLITDAENRRKIEAISGGLPGVKIVVVAAREGETGLQPGDLDFWHEMSLASREFEPVKKAGTDLVVVHYTSGTTGKPKGVMVAENSAMFTIPFAQYALDLKPDDMFWGFADPGWLYALFTVGTGVLTMGGSLFVYGGRLDA